MPRLDWLSTCLVCFAATFEKVTASCSKCMCKSVTHCIASTRLLVALSHLVSVCVPAKSAKGILVAGYPDNAGTKAVCTQGRSFCYAR